MKRNYLIRLDDACPTMNRDRWGRIEALLDKYGIKPMVGVIPHNEDPKQIINADDGHFRDVVQRWVAKDWTIALHGYNHKLELCDGLKGLNPMWRRSEFAGLPIEQQRNKIREGVAILKGYGVTPRYFFAPAHTFDNNTLDALLMESDIRIISDTVATRPYFLKGFIFIPQIGGMCREMKLNGLFTFCLHPNEMDEKAFARTESFFKTHKDMFMAFNQLDLDNTKGKCLFDRVICRLYFLLRSLKGLR